MVLVDRIEQYYAFEQNFEHLNIVNENFKISFYQAQNVWIANEISDVILRLIGIPQSRYFLLILPKVCILDDWKNLNPSKNSFSATWKILTWYIGFQFDATDTHSIIILNWMHM